MFPGCLMPSLGALAQAMSRAVGLMMPRGRGDRRPLCGDVASRGASGSSHGPRRGARLGFDERFERTWDFYLAFCEAAFRTRALRDVQLTLTRAFNERLAP